MRIKSDFHDYYDCIQALGQDQSTVWIRKREEVVYQKSYDFWGKRSDPLWPFPLFQERYRWFGSRTPLFSARIIGFCGKIYPVLVAKHTPASTCSCKGCVERTAICHSIADIDAFVLANFREKMVQGYYITEPKRRKYRYWESDHWPSDYRQEALAQWFSKIEEARSKFEELFREHRTPVFVGYESGDRSGKVVYNACLKEQEFFRVFQPQAAFQEIEMFFGGLAVPQRPIPEIPDKVMVGAKGFDKWSFRKEPRKK